MLRPSISASDCEMALAKKNLRSLELNVSDLTSRELLLRFQAGEDAAAGEVFDRYVAKLLKLTRRRISPKLARRIDPDDVVQSAYRSFFVHARDGDYVVRRAGDLWRLLVAITFNKLYGQVEIHTAQRRDIKREQTHDTTDSESDFPLTDVEPSPAEAAEISEQLRVFMEQLSQIERTILERRLAGSTIEQIADDVDRSQRTVRRLLQNIREQLSRQLSG